jgi:hypothetical protein
MGDRAEFRSGVMGQSSGKANLRSLYDEHRKQAEKLRFLVLAYLSDKFHGGIGSY